MRVMNEFVWAKLWALILCCGLAAESALAQTPSRPADPAASNANVRLFDSSWENQGGVTLRLDPQAVANVRDAGARRIVTEPFALTPDLTASLSLQRFEV